MLTRSFVQTVICALMLGLCPWTAWAAEADLPAPHVLPEASMGEAYEYQLAAQGGVQPLQWSWTGEIPPGLEIDPQEGRIHGTPTQARTAPFVIQVQLKDSSVPPMEAALSFALRVKPKPLEILPPLRITLPEESIPGAFNPSVPSASGMSVAAPSDPTIPQATPTVQGCTAAAPNDSGSKNLAVSDVSAKTLYNPDESWMTNTNILLIVTGDTNEPIKFGCVRGPNKGRVTFNPTGSKRSYYAIYRPNPRETGEDTFTYRAFTGTVQKPDEYSNVATVTVKIEKAGLKWELVTSGATGLSATPEGKEAGVIGKSSPDFLFKLDWQFVDPKLKKGEMKSLAGPVVFVNDRGETAASNHQSTGRLSFQTGVITRPVSVSGTDPEPPPGESGETVSLTYQRAFTAGAEFNYNYVNRADNQGSFFEVGGLARINFDAFLDDEELMQKDDVTFIQLSRSKDRRAFYRFETGVRFVLKQFEEENHTWRQKKGEDFVSLPRNLIDLLTVEAVYQRNDALKGLIPDQPGDSLNRWAVRFFAKPTVPNSGKRAYFLIGMEVNRDFNNGPQDVRIFYGLNANLPRLFN